MNGKEECNILKFTHIILSKAITLRGQLKKNRIMEHNNKSVKIARVDDSFPITLGFGPNANSAVVDVKHGKIIMVWPLL